MTDKNTYKSPLKKLVKFFRESRDKWKAKHQETQKTNKYLKNKNRTLQASKKKWRKEALDLRAKLKKLSTQNKKTVIDIEPCKKKVIRIENPLNEIKIPNHTYSANLIYLLLQLVITASVSMRGSEKVLLLFNDAFGGALGPTPSWLSVRSWLLRFGHYKLMRAKQIADDWCLIIDHTVQLGKTKCLLILGIRLSELPSEGQSLHYQDLEPLDLYPVDTSNGEVVWQQLEKTAIKTGIPRAIVSDYGSDLKLGIEKFCDEHTDCTGIYDIKHKTAILLKGILEKDELWGNFRKQAAQTKNQLQQTALSHLKAPNQRSKSRYMNTEILLDWGSKTLQLLNSDIEFSTEEKEKLPKLQWLNEHEENLEKWTEHLQVITLAEQWVRKKGITAKGAEQLKDCYQQEFPELAHDNSILLKDTLIDFVKNQGEACHENEKLLGSSEMIESVFGKQKGKKGSVPFLKNI